MLIHAGDLTENGSFAEMQRELFWLSSQPHRYKVFVAGNHDVLLDEKFLERYPERKYGQMQTKEDLDWGDVVYLQDASVTLEFPPSPDDMSESSAAGNRSLVLYGSPYTPRYGVSAFQYEPDPEFWADQLAPLSEAPDILIAHGPPKLHLDARDFHRAGCPYLGQEVRRLKLRLHILGHIHASHGRDDVVLDGMQHSYEDVIIGWGGWETVAWMTVLACWERLQWACRGFRPRNSTASTTFVNASVVGGSSNEVVHEAVVLNI